MGAKRVSFEKWLSKQGPLFHCAHRWCFEKYSDQISKYEQKDKSKNVYMIKIAKEWKKETRNGYTDMRTQAVWMGYKKGNKEHTT